MFQESFRLFFENIDISRTQFQLIYAFFSYSKLAYSFYSLNSWRLILNGSPDGRKKPDFTGITARKLIRFIQSIYRHAQLLIYVIGVIIGDPSWADSLTYKLIPCCASLML